jgi:hypothetical protein
MLSLRKLVLLLLVLALAGCAASVRYAPRVRGVIPGYVDQRLGEDTYQVKIGEAWPKDWQDLEKFALYRAAELTQQNGKRYFAVLDASSRVNNYTIAIPATSTTTGTVNTIGSTSYINARTTTTGGGAVNISGGWYTLEFKVVPDSAVTEHRDVVDSQEIMRDLKYFIDSRRP